MNKSTNLVLVSFLEDQPEGETFVRSRHNGWPLHITLVPWFAISDQNTLNLELSDISQRWRQFTVKVGQEKMLGENQYIPVNIIEDQATLKRLHEELLASVLSDGWLLDSRWIKDNYLAHITQHLGVDNHKASDKQVINHVYLVKMLDDDHCQLLKKYSFGVSNETAA